MKKYVRHNQIISYSYGCECALWQLVCFYFVLTTFTTIGYGTSALMNRFDMQDMLRYCFFYRRRHFSIQRKRKGTFILTLRRNSPESGLGFEQIFCIFLFFCSVSLFGTIIAEVNEILMLMRTKSKGLDKILESYLAIQPKWALYLRLQFEILSLLLSLSVCVCVRVRLKRFSFIFERQIKHQNYVSSQEMGTISIYDRLWTSAGKCTSFW